MSRRVPRLLSLVSIAFAVIAIQLTCTSVYAVTAPDNGGTAHGTGGTAPNGEIAFDRVVDASTGTTAIYTVSPSGDHQRQLFSDPNGAQLPHWSPDGNLVSIFCCDDGMAAHIVTRSTGAFRELAATDPTLEVHCGWWTPDGQRLACESFGLTEPSRTGVWTIRASDGGGLMQITSDPGGDDIPGDFAPNGKRLVFVRTDPAGQVGLFVVNRPLAVPHRITPSSLLVDGEFGGSWSPRGNEILFVARTDVDHRRAVWVVHSDGSGLRQVHMTPDCGGASSDPTSRGCVAPSWSPDGTKFAFARRDAATGESHIYTSDPDGHNITQVTDGGLGDNHPDWGPHL